MRNFILIALVAIGVTFTFTQISFAVCGGGPTSFFCNDSAPNPDPDGIQEVGNANNLNVTVSPDAAIDTVSGNGLICVETGPGNDTIDITTANLTCEDDSVNPNDGQNTINITDSTLTSKSDVLDAFNGTNTIYIDGSELLCVGNNSGCEAINMSGGDDNITVIDSVLSGIGEYTIRLGNGSDTLTLGTGADIRGDIQCAFEDAQDNDTVIFAMDVPEEDLTLLSLELASLGPNGSITINDLQYDFENCTNYVNQLVGVKRIRPIPTLSEWGLIAMAGVLGIIGLIAVRRKSIVA